MTSLVQTFPLQVITTGFYEDTIGYWGMDGCFVVVEGREDCLKAVSPDREIYISNCFTRVAEPSDQFYQPAMEKFARPKLKRF